MAKVEHDFPLTRAERAALTPANVLALGQEEVDQLYGRLTAGPIPDGPYLGDLFFARGDDAQAAARGDPRRPRGPDRGGEGRSRRKGRPRALEGQDVLPRRAGAAELHRGLPPALAA